MRNCKDIFIAKTGKNNKWLPLSQHLKDTALTMRYLCGNYVTPSMYAAAGMQIDDFYALCIFCAAVHDIGKATPAFQRKIQGDVPGEYDSMSPHALAGAVILNQYFQVDDSICEIIAAHHGRPRTLGKKTKFTYQLKKFNSSFFDENNKEAYKTAWDEIYEEALSYTYMKAFPNQHLTIQAQMLITGLVIMADWIASNEDYFPLFDVGTMESSADRLQIAIKKLQLPSAWIPEYASLDENIFKEHFGFKPNIMQKTVIEAISDLDNHGIMVIEAPMGMGKTEAALAAAEMCGYAVGSGGIFFGLPTQGTANGIFPRIIDWAKKVSESMKVSVSLAHKDAKSNTLFSSYRAQIDDEDGIKINAWMLGRHRALLPDFVTGTVDQALMAALKKKFVMLLHLGLAGKTVIIDEVHSYDTYMSVFMNTLLAWLGSYKVPVILLSATLTREKRNELLSAYCRDKVNINSEAYPLLSYANSDGASCVEIAADDIPQKTVNIAYAKEEEICGIINENLQDGGCAGVIVDTVGGAQKIWMLLKEAFPDWQVVLLHSRFLPDDRATLESHVLNLVGKHSKARDWIIVVGTQVLEQSLDLDFDLMITDKCPMDLLFQRLGRLHRHNSHDELRPKRLEEARCFILEDENSCKRASMPYAPYILRRTDEMLAGHRVLHIPTDIRSMIDSVYDLNLGSDVDDKKTYMEHLNELEEEAKSWCLPNPADDGCEYKGMLDSSVDGAGGVCYGIHNMDIILLKDAGDVFETFSGKKISKEGELSGEQIAEIFHQSISLRYDEKILNALYTNRGKNGAKWMKESVLTDCIFALMDKNGSMVIENDIYSYSNEYGWRKEE